MQERLGVFLGLVATIGGSVGTYLSSLGESVINASGRPLYGQIDPNAVSSWTLVAVNAMTALAGASCLAFAQFRKTRREQLLADDEAFKDSWEAKIKTVEDESNRKIKELGDALKISSQQYAVLTQKLAVVKKERNLLREKLDDIAKQNEKQTRKLKEVAHNVMEVGKAVNAPMSSDGEDGTAPDMPTMKADPAPPDDATGTDAPTIAK